MLNVLLYNGMIKESTADIVAESGLNLTCLRTIFWRDGENGLSNTCTFTCKNTERPAPCRQLQKDIEP